MDSAGVKAFFDSVSTQWDDMRASFYNEQVIICLASAIDANATTLVVDVGTGTGFVAAGLAPTVDRVIGIDNSVSMLAVARENRVVDLPYATTTQLGAAVAFNSVLSIPYALDGIGKSLTEG